ncbi:hypothetical protein [Aliirhizobium cellulosilyticum]|jgi:hypothetical protein|uniref:Uncharacterized protein n=1 Tax=Aliirhizobium cellulosilyticum TaxID=393664 RepID=A0A7W6SF03_9HYPH|nr:hypothetical protein [Rhizobium cellulosilyticum]MBB4351838.1 hypothetical protein [Rhizobium cellulosilyticum]MBB4415070.1 hypothetical protein [Rhizobium cellulosilyticum]MBB4449762.1 hypothetical protein [Rhizobium cellulosilyticum]
MRPQDEPSLQNHTEPAAKQRQKALFGRSALTLIAVLAAIAACVWIGIAVFGITTGT